MSGRNGAAVLSGVFNSSLIGPSESRADSSLSTFTREHTTRTSFLPGRSSRFRAAVQIPVADVNIFAVVCSQSDLTSLPPPGPLKHLSVCQTVIISKKLEWMDSGTVAESQRFQLENLTHPSCQPPAEKSRSAAVRPCGRVQTARDGSCVPTHEVPLAKFNGVEFTAPHSLFTPLNRGNVFPTPAVFTPTGGENFFFCCFESCLLFYCCYFTFQL